MKKLLFIPLFLLAIANTYGCSGNNNNPQDEREPPAVTPGDGKILITYFSYPEPDGVDAVTGASRLVINNAVVGHVEFLASVIQNQTGADIFRIRTVQQYPASHQPLVDQASEEKASNARPELASRIENSDQYDIIFIGYPNWWGDLPMPLYTFLESHDFSGKTIIPFNSHGGSGLSSTVSTIRSKQPDATVLDGFTVSRNNVGQAANDVIAWLRQIGIIE